MLELNLNDLMESSKKPEKAKSSLMKTLLKLEHKYDDRPLEEVENYDFILLNEVIFNLQAETSIRRRG